MCEKADNFVIQVLLSRLRSIRSPLNIWHLLRQYQALNNRFNFSCFHFFYIYKETLRYKMIQLRYLLTIFLLPLVALASNDIDADNDCVAANGAGWEWDESIGDCKPPPPKKACVGGNFFPNQTVTVGEEICCKPKSKVCLPYFLEQYDPNANSRLSLGLLL